MHRFFALDQLLGIKHALKYTQNEYAGIARGIAHQAQWHVEMVPIQHSTPTNFLGMDGRAWGLITETLFINSRRRNIND